MKNNISKASAERLLAIIDHLPESVEAEVARMAAVQPILPEKIAREAFEARLREIDEEIAGEAAEVQKIQGVRRRADQREIMERYGFGSFGAMPALGFSKAPDEKDDKNTESK